MSVFVQSAAETGRLREYLVDVIRELTVARRIFPVETSLKPSDKIGQYYEVTEDDRTKVTFELGEPDYSSFATEEINPPIPLYSGYLHFNRHDKMRVMKDIFTLNDRQRGLMSQLVNREEKTIVAGNDVKSITALNDEGTTSTNMADILDFGTYVEGVQHAQKAITQMRTLLKNKFENTTVKIIWTSDVDDRARELNSTTDESVNLLDGIAKLLASYNGGNGYKDIHTCNYLGSEAGTGTVSCAVIASDKRHYVIQDSPIEVFAEPTQFGGLAVEVSWRSRLHFKSGVKAAIYEQAVILTA